MKKKKILKSRETNTKRYVIIPSNNMLYIGMLTSWSQVPLKKKKKKKKKPGGGGGGARVLWSQNNWSSQYILDKSINPRYILDKCRYLTGLFRNVGTPIYSLWYIVIFVGGQSLIFLLPRDLPDSISNLFYSLFLGDHSRQLALIVASAVLAGELSLLAALEGRGGGGWMRKHLRFVFLLFSNQKLYCTPPASLKLTREAAVLRKRLAWALFVLLLSTFVCCQPTELIVGFFVFINFQFYPPPPPSRPSH